MIKHRMPVVGAGLHLPVKCADPDTGRVFDADCQAFRDALPKGKKKTSCPRGCRKGAWLYPRYRRNGIKPAGDTTIHFHQGIDIGGEMPGVHDGVVPIVSVTAGKVHYRNDEDNGESYGRTIVIVDDAGVFYLYAHCHSLTRGLEKNVKVVEQQVLGFVGSSGSAEKEHPHLHFEVSLQELPMGRGGADDSGSARPGRAVPRASSIRQDRQARSRETRSR